jgi:hypothetical protein
MARISTSSTGGNVNIQDTNGNPITASNGALNVNVVSEGSSGSEISVYNEVTGIAIGSNATVLTYTVPTGNTLALTRVFMSGDCIGTLELNFNGTANAKGRLCYTQYDLTFNYNSYSLSSGTVVTLVATNNSVESVASFNATLQGVLS